MSSTDRINNLTQSTQRYWYEDGFPDIGYGAYIAAIGLVFLGQALTPPGSPLWLVWSVAGPLVLIGGGLVVNRVVRTLKERVTWPRTGYVSYERARGLSKVFRLLALAVVSAGVSAAIVVVQKNWLNLPAILGLVYAAVFTFLGLRFALKRYVVLALVALSLGLALGTTTMSIEQSGAIYHVAVGTGWILAGWLTWRRYNRVAPAAEQNPK